ncbi:MAG: hypothetical protein ACRDHZ_09505 [Ktedonobacteraceae bacterium]
MKRLTAFLTLVVCLGVLLLGATAFPGNASAQVVSHATVASAHVSAQCSSFTNEVQTNQANSTLIRWVNNCNGAFHCELVAKRAGSFHVFLVDATTGKNVESSTGSLSSGGILNTSEVALMFPTCSGGL